MEFEIEIGNKLRLDTQFSPSSPSFRQTRLNRFLNDLSTRTNEPLYDVNDQTTSNTTTSGHPSTLPVSSSSHPPNSVNLNPEADSFTYMETLLESLAVLGKLGSALDNIAQRLPGEAFSLVEATLCEVEDRAEYTKRQNAGAGPGSGAALGKSDTVYLFAADGKATPLGPPTTVSNKAKGPPVKPSMLRLSALESSAKHMEHEVLKDLFWTLYSKLDAVAQGLRVVSEVANRIGSVRSLNPSCVPVRTEAL